MKVTDNTPKPIERNFTIEVSEDELRFLTAAAGHISSGEYEETCREFDLGKPKNTNINHNIYNTLHRALNGKLA